MGSGSSRTYVIDGDEAQTNYAVTQTHRVVQRRAKLPLQAMVAHYTPASFPILPMINPDNAAICRESWKQIMSANVVDEYGGSTRSGLTVFYNEFYERFVHSFYHFTQ
jgi:hypothetical protein